MPTDKPLSELAKDIDLESSIPLRRQLLSEDIAGKMLALFKTSVQFTVFITVLLATIDYIFIAFNLMKPADRLITEKVLMAIIGASLVQLGAVVAAIVYAVFKQPVSVEPPGGEET